MLSEAGVSSATGSSIPPWMKNDRKGNNSRSTGEDLRRRKSRSRERGGSKSKPSELDNQNASTLERDVDPDEDIFARDESLNL